MNLTSIAPSDMLESLKAKARPQKQRNLDVVHSVCEEAHKSGSSDYSLSTIGRMAHGRGGPSPRTLYTAQSEDFRTLVAAWKSFHAASSGRRVQLKPLGEEDLVRRIEDPAMRSLLGAVVAERNRLRAEINVLRTQANIVIDRKTASPSSPGHVQVIHSRDLLTQIERESLQHAIAATFLAQEGWSEGEHGEIINGKGRRLFGHGYATAIRKLLA